MKTTNLFRKRAFWTLVVYCVLDVLGINSPELMSAVNHLGSLSVSI